MLELMLSSGMDDDGMAPDHPVGQVTYNTVGTFTWVVPENVTHISVAVLGPGRAATPVNAVNSGPTNAGGALVFLNNIKVTPGAGIQLTVGGPSNPAHVNITVGVSRCLGLAAGPFNLMTIPKGGVGWAGGTGSPMGRQGLFYWGGGAGALNGPGHAGQEGFVSTNAWPAGWDADLTVYRGSSVNQANFGAGSVITDTYTYHRPAQRGIVRIIWGNDRSFPSQNIQNM